MLGNGFEITLKNHDVILKAEIATHGYKEGFKAKSKLTGINENIVFNRTSFRCVKPIFSWRDLEELEHKEQKS